MRYAPRESSRSIRHARIWERALSCADITEAYDGWPDPISCWCRVKANRADVLLRFGAFELDLSTAELRKAGDRAQFAATAASNPGYASQPPRPTGDP